MRLTDETIKIKKATQKSKTKPKDDKTPLKYSVEDGIMYCEKTGKYYVSFYYGKDGSGKQIREQKTFSTLKEARAAKKAFEARKTLNISITSSKQPFGECVKDYIGKKQIEQATRYQYQGFLKHINCYPISRIAVSKLTADDIRGYAAALLRNDGLKPQTINKHLVLITSVLDNAVKEEKISRNVARLVERYPVREKQKITPLSVEECKNIFSALETWENRNVAACFYLGIYLGLRKGEMLALKWENINFEEGYLRIVASKAKGGGKAYIKDPKTESSKRTLKISPSLSMFLQERKAEIENAYDSCEYVFVGKGGESLGTSALNKACNYFFETTGLRQVRIHDLRHTFGTLAVEQGVDIYRISKAMGHSTTAITQSVYLHPSEHINETAAQAVSELFS